jgi:hypothetical protein
MRFPTHDAADEVLVSPPCLAGGGDARWITAALPLGSGWRYEHAPLAPYVHLVSPGQQAELALYPDPDEPWWTVLHATTGERPAWYARFGARMPVEILAAFTDTLTVRHPADTAASDPFEPLYAAGWLEDADRSAVSPDGMVRVEHADQGRGSWLVTTALPHSPDAVIWRAHLDRDTPPHLVAALTRALTDPAPLRRDPLALPHRVRPHVRIAPVPDAPASAVDPLEQRVKDLAVRHRRTAPPPPPDRPGPPPGRTR